MGKLYQLKTYNIVCRRPSYFYYSQVIFAENMLYIKIIQERLPQLEIDNQYKKD